MRHAPSCRAGVAVVLVALSFVPNPSAAPVATAWTNGSWFDGTGFRRIAVYSVDDRLTLKRPDTIDRTVDLAGGFVTAAFGEAHTHQVTSGDADASIPVLTDPHGRHGLVNLKSR